MRIGGHDAGDGRPASGAGATRGSSEHRVSPVEPVDPAELQENRARRAPDAGPPLDASDDVDRVFARLAPLPAPRDFAANVLLAARTSRAGRRQVAWAAASLAAVIALGLLAFLAGQTLVGSGALDLLGALAGDASVMRLMPGEALLALAETLPWLEFAGVVLAAAAAGWCARGLSRSLAEAAPRRPAAPARGHAGGA